MQSDETHIDHMDPTFLYANDTQEIQQSLLSFLRKPIIIAQNNFSTTDTYSFFNNYSMPYTALTGGSSSLWVDKLAGFFGIRMDMRFRLVVNANRFQQGRYCMGWVPLGGSAITTSNLKQNLFNNMHMATLTQRTTVHHVEIDLNTETAAELLVPFVSTQTFWPLSCVFNSSDYSPLGYINVYPYSPLVSPAGSTTASYTLYVSFENVQLFGAASPQANGKSLREREVANKQNGPISGIASSISRGFKEFSNIPVLSEIATPVSWIADRVANVASIFGFSKPSQGDSLTKQMLLNAPNHTTIDGDSDARALSYLSLPATVPVKGLAGTDFDEMDFSYITRKYAYCDRFTWDTSTTVGNLYTRNVGINNYVNFGSVVSYTPAAFVANFFLYWRGSMKYKFKMVKTEFHSGRIQVCFYPTDDYSNTADPYYVNRQIIDIREDNEFEVIVPFISRFGYIPQGGHFGVLTIDVVDQLIAPSTVSSSITFLLEVCAGDDVEFAIPAPFNVVPQYAVPQSNMETSGSKSGTNKHLSFTIGNTSINANPVVASSYCIGDKISSFRAMLKRFSPIAPSSRVAASTKRLNGTTAVVTPDMVPVASTSTTTYLWFPDNVGIVASCYLMWSGGIRLRDVYDFASTANPTLITNSNMITATYGTPVSYNQTDIATSNSSLNYCPPNYHMVLQTAVINNVITVEVPQYTTALSRNLVDIMSFQADSPASYMQYTSSASATQASVSFNGPTKAGANTSPTDGYDLHNVYRALSDDGNFSYFISVPPMLSVGSIANANFA
mgnify:CR=1 FL=1